MPISIVPTKRGMQDIDRSTFGQTQNIIDDNNRAGMLNTAGSVSDNELRKLNPDIFAEIDAMQGRAIQGKRNKLEEMGVNTRMMSDQEIIMMDMGMKLASGELNMRPSGSGVTSDEEMEAYKRALTSNQSGTGVTTDKDLEMIMQLKNMGFSDEDVIATLMQQLPPMQTDVNMGALNNLNVPSPEARSQNYETDNILMGGAEEATPGLMEALNPNFRKGMEMFGDEERIRTLGQQGK